jgi:hypothetical protein
LTIYAGVLEEGAGLDQLATAGCELEAGQPRAARRCLLEGAGDRSVSQTLPRQGTRVGKRTNHLRLATRSSGGGTTAIASCPVMATAYRESGERGHAAFRPRSSQNNAIYTTHCPATQHHTPLSFAATTQSLPPPNAAAIPAITNRSGGTHKYAPPCKKKLKAGGKRDDFALDRCSLRHGKGGWRRLCFAARGLPPAILLEFAQAAQGRVARRLL